MSCLPQSRDKLGTRTVICVKSADCIVFGETIGDTENCGAWVTDLREWLEYEREQQSDT